MEKQCNAIPKKDSISQMGFMKIPYSLSSMCAHTQLSELGLINLVVDWSGWLPLVIGSFNIKKTT